MPTHVPVAVDDAELVPGARAISFAGLADRDPTSAVDLAFDQVGPDTIAKFLLTSGSTGLRRR